MVERIIRAAEDIRLAGLPDGKTAIYVSNLLLNVADYAKENKVPLFLPSDHIETENNTYVHPRFTFNWNLGTVRRKDGEVIGLTNRESRLLYVLSRCPNQLLSYDQLLELVWGIDSPMRNNIAIHVMHLRRKIEDDPKNPEIIIAHSGVGYLLVDLSRRKINK